MDNMVWQMRAHLWCFQVRWIALLSLIHKAHDGHTVLAPLLILCLPPHIGGKQQDTVMLVWLTQGLLLFSLSVVSDSL